MKMTLKIAAFVFAVFFIFACGDKKDKEQQKQDISSNMTADDEKDNAKMFAVYDTENFKKYIAGTFPVKSLPIEINTDDFEDKTSETPEWPSKYFNTNLNADFFKKSYICYRLDLKENINTLAVFAQPSEMESEVYLLNYDKDFKFSDILKVAYGDYAENLKGCSCVADRDKITLNEYIDNEYTGGSGETKPVRNESTEIYGINQAGKFFRISSEQAKRYFLDDEIVLIPAAVLPGVEYLARFGGYRHDVFEILARYHYRFFA